MTIDVYVASAFSKNNAGGNKAGVVLQCNALSESDKTNIAYQLGYSETAFISQSEQADFKLEYYTPMGEVPLCGHATIASFITLRQLQLLGKSAYTIQTKSGILKIDTDSHGLIFMEQKTPEYYDTLDVLDVRDCFRSGAFGGRLPIQIVSTGLKDILLPIANPAALENMIPDFSVISKVSQERDCVGIHAFTLLNQPDLTAICRNFAPLYGIDEEAATGTSNCALACYLHRYGIKQNLYIFEQGYNLKSPSRIYVKIESTDDRITSVSAGGDGYLLGRKSVSVRESNPSSAVMDL